MNEGPADPAQPSGSGSASTPPGSRFEDLTNFEVPVDAVATGHRTAILITAQTWKAHYEWFAHAPMAEKAGVKPQTIKDIQAGRTPKTAAKDELAIIDFVKEMYKTRRASDKTYKRVHAFLGDAGVVELVGICGYYAMISMTLNVFRAQIPEDAALPFAEPK